MLAEWTSEILSLSLSLSGSPCTARPAVICSRVIDIGSVGHTGIGSRTSQIWLPIDLEAWTPTSIPAVPRAEVFRTL